MKSRTHPKNQSKASFPRTRESSRQSQPSKTCPIGALGATRFPASAGNHGVSLLEVITAFSVLVVGLFLFTGVFSRNMNQTRTLVQEQRALEILENEIERARAQSTEISLGEGQPLFTAAEELEFFPNAQGSRSVTEHGPGLRKLEVRLRWMGPNNRTREQSLTTLVAAP